MCRRMLRCVALNGRAYLNAFTSWTGRYAVAVLVTAPFTRLWSGISQLESLHKRLLEPVLSDLNSDWSGLWCMSGDNLPQGMGTAQISPDYGHWSPSISAPR